MFIVIEADWYRTAHVYADKLPEHPKEVGFLDMAVHTTSLW